MICADQLQALEGVPLSSEYQTDGLLISASTVAHCGVKSEKKESM